MSIRQLNPALVAAEARRIGGIVDEPRGVVENTAGSLRVVVVDEGLSPDDLDPPRSLEILTSEAALLLKIDEFEHGTILLSNSNQRCPSFFRSALISSKSFSS